jgi:hypothetical protein
MKKIWSNFKNYEKHSVCLITGGFFIALLGVVGSVPGAIGIGGVVIGIGLGYSIGYDNCMEDLKKESKLEEEK